MRLSDYLANYLYNIGVKNIYMLSGTGSIYLDDAFANQRDMQHICARHEAAAVLMAEASAKLTGIIGVVIATTGPGGTNAIGGVVEAWVDSVPILVISGQVNSSQISPKTRSYGIQGFNIIENVQKITKYAVQVSDSHQIRFHLEKAIHMATTGRPGPVWLDIPFEVQTEKISPDELVGYTPENPIIKSNKDKVTEVIDILFDSNKPLIVFGQGIRHAGAITEFKQMLEQLKIPSIAARMGLDILPYSNPYFFGLGGMRGHRAPAVIMKECDLIIALGTSVTHAFAGNNYDQYNPLAKLIMINIDSHEMKKPGINADLAIEMGLKEFISTFIKTSNDHNRDNKYSKWLKKCSDLKKDLPTVLSSYAVNPINSYYFVECLNRHSKDNHIFVNDAGSANYICSQGLKLQTGQREITSGAFYSMGIALPLAIGAAVTEPKSQIIAITGDGSIELNIQELRTMSQNNLNIKLFVINNGGYTSIRKSQKDMVGGRYTDDEEVLNFSNVANAFELPFHILDDYEKLDLLIPDILTVNGPELIEVVCDPKQEIIEPFKTDS